MIAIIDSQNWFKASKDGLFVPIVYTTSGSIDLADSSLGVCETHHFANLISQCLFWPPTYTLDVLNSLRENKIANHEEGQVSRWPSRHRPFINSEAHEYSQKKRNDTRNKNKINLFSFFRHSSSHEIQHLQPEEAHVKVCYNNVLRLRESEKD